MTKYTLTSLIAAVLFMLTNSVLSQTYGERDAVILEEFVFQSAPFPSCHAATLAQTADGTLTAAWFGGYNEGHKRVGIWLSQKIDGRWTPPVEVANGLQKDGGYRATWNPVLFQPESTTSESLPLQLHFKTGKIPSGWQGEVMFSKDNGKTWYGRKVLPNDGIGPVRNKPITLQNGKILCPSSDETGNVWTSHLEITDVNAEQWERTPPLHTPEEAQTIQPALLQFKDGRILMLCRDKNPNGHIWQCWSQDNGKNWGKFSPTILPNPNSGIDAVALKDGRFLLIYNHTVGKPENPDDPAARTMLNLAVSKDGITWDAVCIFENQQKSEFSYPAIIQTKDGLVHAAYTWKRQLIKHVVVDPAKIKGIPMHNGQWSR